MKYVAAVNFIDIKDGERFYEKGEPWPRKGLKPDKKRVEALLTGNNAAGKPLIAAVEEEPEDPDTPEDAEGAKGADGGDSDD